MSTVLKSVPDSPDKLWGKLRRNDPEGEAYLEGRGLSRAVELGSVRFNDGAVRFAGAHDYRVVLALHDTNGEVAQLQARAINPEAKGRDRQRSMTGVPYPPDGAAMGNVKEARTARRVYLTEGIADTLALLIAGVTAIGAPGTGSLKHLPKFLGKPKGREVVLCVQNDEKGQSAKAFADLEKGLRKAGATVTYLRTPQDVGKDPADWLKKIGEEAFAVAAESAVLVPEPIEPEQETAANDDEGVTTTEEARQELADACEKIEEAKNKKGDVLYGQAYRMGRWIGGREMVEEEASEALRATARAAGIAEYKGHITRGIRDGKKKPRTGAIKAIAQQLAFVASQNCYWDTICGGPFFGAALETKYRQEVIAAGHEKAKLVQLVNRHIAQADDLGWEPGRTPPRIGSSQDRIFEENGKRLFNMWRDPPTPPGKGKFATPKLWLDHVEFVIPIAEEREHFFDVLAYNVQYLGGKVNHAIVLQGERGIGKDAMWKPLSAWFGAVDAWGEASIDELESQFDYHFKGKKVLLIGEATAHGVRNAQALYDKLKSKISASAGGRIRLNLKNLHPIEVPNRLQFIFTTNYSTALWFDTATDRAHFVIKSPVQVPREPDHYNRLHEFYGDVKGGREGFYEKGKVDVIGWLAHRPLTGRKGRKGRPDFNPKAEAPHTTAREEMYAATRSGNERVVGEIIERAGDVAVLSVAIVANLLHSDEHRKAREWLVSVHRQAVAKLFAEKGYLTDRGVNVTVNGKETKHTIYYKGMSKEDAVFLYRAKLRKPPGGG